MAAIKNGVGHFRGRTLANGACHVPHSADPRVVKKDKAPSSANSCFRADIGRHNARNRILLLNISAFYIKYENRLFNTIDGTTLEEVTGNVGPSHNYGVEGDFVLKATPEITFSGGFGLTQAKWDNIPGYQLPC